MSENSLGKNNAKWDDATHIIFIELCEQEIRKGNRPNTYLSIEGWNTMIKEFNDRTRRNYSKKQMKNHWDSMKAEWTLFKQLMRGETGLGWDPVKNTILADNDWWERKIKENPKYRKFRHKDLSLIWYRYNALFSDIVATGDRARASNQEPMPDIGLDFNDEGTYDIDGNNTEQFNDERCSEIDDLHTEDPIVFPEPSLNKKKPVYGVGTSRQVKKSKKNHGVTTIREDIHSLIEFMSSKSTTTSPTSNEPTVDMCFDMLENIPDIPPGSGIYNYSLNLFLKKEMRQVFYRIPTNEARKSWLEHNYYELFLKKK